MKLLFWLVKNKADNSRLAPIYAQITINGKSVECSTGIVEFKIIPGNPLVVFTVKKGKTKPIIALDEEEFQKLTSHQYASQRL